MSAYRSGMIAVVGRPNAGKSTLVNQLVGEKVGIVSDKPQTTRRRILGIVERDGLQIALIDTPGIHRPEHRMNAVMVRDAIDALEGVDAALFVVDASDRRGAEERFVAKILRSPGRPPVIVAVNKIDRVRKPALLPLLAELHELLPDAELVPVSALTGDGADDLLSAIERRIPEGPPLYPQGEKAPGPIAEKIAEQIREPALAALAQELPFALAVVIERIEERPEGEPTVVTAELVVEREGQKAIVIGRGGEMIQRIGTAARLACEERFGGRFYLDLRVATRRDWREDDRFLNRVVNAELLSGGPGFPPEDDESV